MHGRLAGRLTACGSGVELSAKQSARRLTERATKEPTPQQPADIEYRRANLDAGKKVEVAEAPDDQHGQELAELRAELDKLKLAQTASGSKSGAAGEPPFGAPPLPSTACKDPPVADEGPAMAAAASSPVVDAFRGFVQGSGSDGPISQTALHMGGQHLQGASPAAVAGPSGAVYAPFAIGAQPTLKEQALAVKELYLSAYASTPFSFLEG